jgi:hypothetical protein
LRKSRVLRRIFGPRRNEEIGELLKRHNKELNDLSSSSIIVRVIKPRRMKWAGACSSYGGEKKAYTGFWWGNLREKDHFQDPGVDERVN